MNQAHVIEGMYKRPVWKTPDYQIVRYEVTKMVSCTGLPNLLGKEISVISGDIPEVKEPVIITGALKAEPSKNGPVRWTVRDPAFKFSELKTEEGLYSFLRSIPGIGEKTVSKLQEAGIVETHIEALARGEESIEASLAAKYLNSRQIENITVHFQKRKWAIPLYEFLSPYGISNRNISTLFKRHGTESLEKIKANPYILTTLPRISYYKADEVAKGIGFPMNSIKRFAAAVKEVLIQGEKGGLLFSRNSGHMWLGLKLVKESTEVLIGNNMSWDVFIDALEKTERKGDIKRYTFPDGTDALYLARNFEIETEISKRLTLLSKHKKAGFNLTEKEAAEVIASEEKSAGITLNENQRKGVNMALMHDVTIVTGSAGTGKTTQLKIMIGSLKKAGCKDILLISPTGRAAKKMNEATGERASTIHKALEIIPGVENSVTNSDSYIEAGVIIVDEMSMVSAKLFCTLVLRIKVGAKLIIIGDPYQLPAIDAGNVLDDLIKSGVITTTHLTEVQRQAGDSLIVSNANIIRDGKGNLKTGPDFRFVAASDLDITYKSVQCYIEKVEEYGIDNVCLLSPFRQKGDSGGKLTSADTLNESLRNILNPPPKSGKGGARTKDFTLFPKDRVMCKKNLGEVANGDIGYVEKITFEKAEAVMWVKFPFGNETLGFPRDESNEFTLAYAMSIHKSQGSEYECVIMILDHRHDIMLKRNLIYTGITRAKKEIILIGEKEAFLKGLASVDDRHRNTGLTHFLREYSGEPDNPQMSFL